MTKIEKNKCEKLINQAIQELIGANELYEDDKEKNKDSKIATIQIRLADNKRGYAEGMYNALVAVGYKSEKLDKFTQLLTGKIKNLDK
ncbi:hypothetical protein [Clostridium butyricum]|uniref:hypothetical protein n=1 Tax=Clostridium butyricum TaxID=1492 RepID=UPI00374F42D0